MREKGLCISWGQILLPFSVRGKSLIVRAPLEAGEAGASGCAGDPG